MAHSYSHLFNLPASGLRFFSVYGSWGRPDMALFNLLRLLEYIAAIERELGKEIKKNMLPMQAGDVAATHADTSALELLGYKPKVSIDEGVAKFIAWYKSYFKIKAQG